MSIFMKDHDLKFEEFKSFEQALEYEKESIAWNFSINIKKYMRINKIKTKEIAIKINKSPAYVSRALNQGQNLTIKSMAELALALNFRLNFDLVQDRVHDDITVDKIIKHVNWKLPNPSNSEINIEFMPSQPSIEPEEHRWFIPDQERVHNGD